LFWYLDTVLSLRSGVHYEVYEPDVYEFQINSNVKSTNYLTEVVPHPLTTDNQGSVTLTFSSGSPEGVL